ncbi:MAG: NUDIX domain-containing protein [Clostridia bacterium]|nr:NUDIX domain-containing protein [Clostridia bacterium]
MEILDVYDINNKKTGKTIVRGNKNLLEGEFIKLVVIWIEDDGKYLVQKCSEEKGSVYAITGGHVSSGNTATHQAVIEIKEELGVDIKESDLKLLGTITKNNAMFEVYILNNTIKQNTKFVLQESEVESVSWLDKSQIDVLIKNGVFRKSSQMHYEKFIK